MMNGSGKWRKRRARGEIIIVRSADDLIVGFQYESDGRTFLVELRERLEKFIRLTGCRRAVGQATKRAASKARHRVIRALQGTEEID